MTLYSVIVFFHVLGMLALFAALVLEGVSLWHLRAGRDADVARLWANVSTGVLPVSAIAMPLLFLPGAYLAREGRLWSQGWLQVGILATFLVAGMTGAITRPRMRAIERAAADAKGGVSSVLLTHLRDPLLRLSLQLRCTLGLGTVFLMIAKTNHANALAVMALALVSGFAASAIHRSPRRAAALTS